MWRIAELLLSACNSRRRNAGLRFAQPFASEPAIRRPFNNVIEQGAPSGAENDEGSGLENADRVYPFGRWIWVHALLEYPQQLQECGQIGRASCRERV